MSINRKRTAMMVISSVAAAGVLLPATASHAAEVPADRSRPVAVQPEAPSTINGRGRVEVITKIIELTTKLYEVVNNAIERNQNRSGYVKSLMEGSFYEAGQRYNVMVINDANRYSSNLHGVVYDAKVSGHHGTYRVIVFESGQFTNHGDGGWINWAFRGWFDRDGGYVNFRRSW
ncbi:YwqI/YxiC family protein [Streptomyces somaliensis DSM 40738]|uniref:YwqI/YxiC family protein n=1 Tax=Streptomyces somaliensis (strain ATCC 33201 / DSM 40738 / JCM 12659 / KCTC 9044 / NCTC 11332 / NRRL B-12077 / IP 733) TaxID=1134445 RepID=A0AA44DAW6_STRE0|nr:YwqI/YxiC family protein [Streptomyces somaliensis]MCQ0023944.1 YwqI/YxiC family protein [Streptomyces somaliensis DSM 40738]NKY13098.1 YwqI/YxiC family protein [Streptomyces somaliensis DSM 40738]